MIEYILQTEDLTKHYQHAPALNGLSMHVPKGGHLRLCGQKRRRKDHADPPDLRTAKAHLRQLHSVRRAPRREPVRAGCPAFRHELPGSSAISPLRPAVGGHRHRLLRDFLQKRSPIKATVCPVLSHRPDNFYFHGALSHSLGAPLLMPSCSGWNCCCGSAPWPCLLSLLSVHNQPTAP